MIKPKIAQQPSNNLAPIWIAIGAVAALVIALGSWLMIEKSSKRNDEETAQRYYEIRNMSDYKLNKPSDDPLIKQERQRRYEETKRLLWVQNRD